MIGAKPRRRSTELALLSAVLGAGLVFSPRAWGAAPRCDGNGPWVLVELRAESWTEAQRGGVVGDLQHTLAPQGIAACVAGARPSGEPLATLAIELAADGKATVDIEVRDAVTKKRVRREVDLTGIPADGRELAVAIEADELLRASWAEVALDTERARAAERRREVAGSVGQVLAPARVQGSGALGARAAGEIYLGGATLLGADAFGRVRLGGRAGLELGGEIRAGPSVASDNGRVSALAAGGSVSLLFRVAGSHAASVDVGAGVSGAWLQFRADPDPGAAAESYANLLLVGRLRVIGRLALGRSMHAAAGFHVGETLRGVAATDAGEVVRSASGLVLGATLGLEAP
jgi:hypothetical protein